jgi:hypothetical protein
MVRLPDWHRHHQSSFPIRSDGVFLSSPSPDSFFPNYCIPDVPRSNASLKPNCRRLDHALNSASQSDPETATAQDVENASLAMNDVLPGTTTKDRFVPGKHHSRFAPTRNLFQIKSMKVNCNRTNMKNKEFEHEKEL